MTHRHIECRIWCITVSLVAIEIFVLCDPTPGWRLGYVMRVVATCVIFSLGCACFRDDHDILVCMFVAISMHWETSILRWVTPEVQWWAGESSSKMWLLFVALLQLNQGSLMERIRRKVLLQVWMISPTVCITDLLHVFDYFVNVYTSA